MLTPIAEKPKLSDLQKIIDYAFTPVPERVSEFPMVKNGSIADNAILIIQVKGWDDWKAYSPMHPEIWGWGHSPVGALVKYYIQCEKLLGIPYKPMPHVE